MTIGIVILGAARAEEALRAALGLTLAGDRVVCALVDDAASALGAGAGTETRRHIDTLEMLGHDVGAALPDALAADVVEVWT